jgi:hypothetical protein
VNSTTTITITASDSNTQNTIKINLLPQTQPPTPTELTIPDQGPINITENLAGSFQLYAQDNLGNRITNAN